MMMAILLLASLQAVVAPEIVREQRTLAIPREVGRAVEPYVVCMLEDRNARILGSRTGDAARAAAELVRTDCRSARDRSEMLARERLHASSIPEADRALMIENALSTIDRIYDYIAERLDAAAGQRSRDE